MTTPKASRYQEVAEDSRSFGCLAPTSQRGASSDENHSRLPFLLSRGPGGDFSPDRPRGFLWTWRNGPRRLLIYFLPRAGAVVDCQYLPWKTQRLFHQWSPPVCLYQKFAAIKAAAASELRFDTLLIPHDPEQDPAQLAAGVQAGVQPDGDRWITLTVAGQRLKATRGRDGPTLQRLPEGTPK